jgi:hypothetical protein
VQKNALRDSDTLEIIEKKGMRVVEIFAEEKTRCGRDLVQDRKGEHTVLFAPWLSKCLLIQLSVK